MNNKLPHNFYLPAPGRFTDDIGQTGSSGRDVPGDGSQAGFQGGRRVAKTSFIRCYLASGDGRDRSLFSFGATTERKVEVVPVLPIPDQIDSGFSALKINQPEQALLHAESVLLREDRSSIKMLRNASLLKARAHYNLNRYEESYQFISSLPLWIREDKSIQMCLGLVFQHLGMLESAKSVLENLFYNESPLEGDKLKHGLALGFVYRLMGQLNDERLHYHWLAQELSGKYSELENAIEKNARLLASIQGRATA